MMKVLYIAHCADLDGSGRALLHLLTGVGRQVSPIVILPKKGLLLQELKLRGIRTLVLPFSIDIWPPMHSLLDLFLWLPRLLRTCLLRELVKVYVTHYVRKEHIELVHTNSSVIHWGSDVAKRCRIPHVWHVRECQDIGLSLSPLGGMETLKKKMAERHNHCIAITRFVFQHHHLTDGKDYLIYDGVFHEDKLKMPVFYTRGNYFLYVGTLSKSKGCYDAIKAFEQVASEVPNVELWLAGEKNTSAIEAVSKSVYSSRIRLLGFRKDIYDLMQKAIATLVPTFFEVFGFVTTEAMLNGCLVIGRNTAGTKEQFDNGLHSLGKEIGLRFNNVEELASKMMWACQANDEEIKVYTTGAREIVAKYTIERSCEQLSQLYSHLSKVDMKI